jgi:hypothetical protein
MDLKNSSLMAESDFALSLHTLAIELLAKR